MFFFHWLLHWVGRWVHKLSGQGKRTAFFFFVSEGLLMVFMMLKYTCDMYEAWFLKANWMHVDTNAKRIMVLHEGTQKRRCWCWYEWTQRQKQMHAVLLWGGCWSDIQIDPSVSSAAQSALIERFKKNRGSASTVNFSTTITDSGRTSDHA